MAYVATTSVPGYLPMDDDPPVFDTAAEAWQYLAEECARGGGDYVPDDPEDLEGPQSESATYACLQHNAEVKAPHVCGHDTPHWPDHVGTVYGSTPGYDGDHDLGLAYSVSVAE